MTRSLLLLFLAFCMTGFGQTFEVEKIEFKFRVQKWESINSKFSDFGAVLYEDQVVFCSERNIDKVNIGENNWKKGKHYNIISFEIMGDTIVTAELKKPKLFAEKFTSNSHTGPICFSETKDTIFFSRVEKAKLKGQKGKHNFKPQLYMAIRQKKGWSKLEKLPFNEKGYSFSHPSFDSKKKVLYFASDRPGGLGESDIYRAKLDSVGSFSIVENLGSEINSSSKEMFPFYVGGDLFFSSDKEGGNGGLDLYWSYEKEAGWNKTELLGTDINTTGDDFSVYMYADQTRGFIASNVNGNDDIFYFDMEKKVTLQSELIGKFSYRNLDNDLSNIKVQLTSDDIDMVFETVSDDKGNFRLRELPSGEKYKIDVVNNSDDDLYVTFYDQKGNVVSRMIINGKGNFEYKELKNESSLISLIDNEDDFDLNSTYTGKIVTSDNGVPHKTIQVALIDGDGNVIQRTETDKFGNFELKEIDYSANNRLKIENPDDDYGLFIFNEKGEIVAKLRIDENGVFTYRQLENESTDLELITTTDDDFTFNKQYYLGVLEDKKGQVRVDTTIIEVYDKNKNQVGNARITPDGNFVFSELPVDDLYLFKTNYPEEELTLYLYDFKGKLVAKLIRKPGEEFFVYKVIGSSVSDISKLNNDDSTDFNFQNGNNIKNENSNNVNASNFTGEEKDIIYFDVNSSYMTDKEKAKLASLISELKSCSGEIYIEGHTDINGENDYNKWLSERRCERVKNYLIAKGIPSSKLKVAFYGEEKPEKLCPGGNCSDEQVHKFNRRVSLKY